MGSGAFPNRLETARREAVWAAVTGGAVGTHRELLDRLARQGIRTSQATLSRDLKALDIMRVSDPGGGRRYLSRTEWLHAHPAEAEQMQRLQTLLTGAAVTNRVFVVAVPHPEQVAQTLKLLRLPGLVDVWAGPSAVWCAFHPQAKEVSFLAQAMSRHRNLPV